MYKIRATKNIEDNYKALYAAIDAHMTQEPDVIANMANISSFIYHSLADVNWAGFYLLKGDTLVLGPFVGKPACTRIVPGSGVCGACHRLGQVVVVPDVSVFEGHIACDGDTKSEIVLPLFKDDVFFGVLDIDSPVLNRFTEIDEKHLTKIALRVQKGL